MNISQVFLEINCINTVEKEVTKFRFKRVGDINFYYLDLKNPEDEMFEFKASELFAQDWILERLPI